MSVAPPGGNTITTRTGFDGYCCAEAAPHASMSRTNQRLNEQLRVMPLLLNDTLGKAMRPDGSFEVRLPPHVPVCQILPRRHAKCKDSLPLTGRGTTLIRAFTAGEDRMAATITLRVNGKSHAVRVDDLDMPLLYALRNELDLHGPRFGCG